MQEIRRFLNTFTHTNTINPVINNPIINPAQHFIME